MQKTWLEGSEGVPGLTAGALQRVDHGRGRRGGWGEEEERGGS